MGRNRQINWGGNNVRVSGGYMIASVSNAICGRRALYASLLRIFVHTLEEEAKVLRFDLGCDSVTEVGDPRSAC